MNILYIVYDMVIYTKIFYIFYKKFFTSKQKLVYNEVTIY